MKNMTKRIISVVMAFIICIMTTLPAFAQSFDEINRTCPKVYVHGFMASDIYVDIDDPNSELAWPIPSDNILDTVKEAVGPLAKVAVDRDLDKFGNALAPILDKLFAPACSDFNGEVPEGSGIRFEYPAPEEIKTNSTVNFKYDWRVDPIISATQLNDFINYVIECSGSNQVVLECHSLGGVITTTYLKLFGNDKIKSVLFNSSAVYGETYTGELLQSKIDLDGKSLLSFLEFCFDNSGYENMMSLIFGILAEAGLLEFVCNFGDTLLEGIYDEVILSVMKLFANWPTIWAMVPDSDVEAAEKNIFSFYDEKGIEYAGLKEKLLSYNTMIRPFKTATLKNTAESSNLYVISRYGYSSIPVTPTWYSLGDGVVDTKFSSFGATTAPYGEKLDIAEGKYLSPDKTVDASTCLFPEQTWFMKSIKHSDSPECLEKFADTLLYHDGLASIDTFEEYPQYMEYDIESDSLKADTGIEALTFFDKLRLFIFKIIEAFKSIFA